MNNALIVGKLPVPKFALHGLASLVVAVLVASPALAGRAGQGNRPVVHAPAQTATNGPWPEESRLRQRELHAWLKSQMPPGVVDTAIRVQLSPDENRDLEKVNPGLG